MSLKIFIPDWTEDLNMPFTIPPLYPFLKKEIPNETLVKQYGDWVNDVKFVPSIQECDVVVLLYEVGYYYKYNKVNELQKINRQAIAANKLTVCWSKGDEGITPPLQNFHLYRMGGYRSKNKGNQFLVPVFIEDPLTKYFANQLPVILEKSAKPLIGFCGQGKAGLAKFTIDILRGIIRRGKHVLGKNYFDLEELSSSTVRRSNILDALERSPLVTTNFIRHAKYRAGLTTRESKEESNKVFFENMKQSAYIICYRGAGNFSVRLYETLASGRIPVIIYSDNNLPFENEIAWNDFPMVPAADWKKMDAIVHAYHAALSNDDFVELQLKARSIYETFISYKGFMNHWVKRYEQATTAKVNSSVQTA